jgi:hypothetical protein
MFASCVVWRFEAGNLYFVYKNAEIPFLSLAIDPLATFRDINAFCSTLHILEIPGSDLGLETCHPEGGSCCIC